MRISGDRIWLVLILIPLVMACVFLYVDVPYLFGIIGFYLLPGIYAAVTKNIDVRYPIAFAVVVSAPFSVIVDYIGTASNLWHVPESLFPLFLSLLPPEDFMWMIAAIFTILMVSNVSTLYAIETFFNARMKMFVLLEILSLSVFFGLCAVYGQNFFSFHTPYLYLILGTAAFGLPTLALAIRHRKDLPGYIPAVAYFLYLTAIFEAVAVYNAWWEFNGNYFLPSFVIIGKALPTEELLFVGIVGPLMTVLLYTSFFAPRPRGNALIALLNSANKK